MKLDVEGAEMLALEGFREHLASGIPDVMILEAHDHSLKKMGSSRSEVLGMLKSYGYEFWTFDPESARLERLLASRNDDFLAIRRTSLERVAKRLA